jgi:DNA mismatch repair protein MutL
MSDIIHLLPDNVANQIAAGEVIQRPASAVKELLENSVDSGASEIKLIVKDAGKTLIQVIDNGCGMSPMDARMSLERHATSKISKADDLFSIRTMGFRGEALPSIAAISMLELKTRTLENELASCLEIEGNIVKNQYPVAAPAGTSISVKNLFFNVPARRNFLKSEKIEFNHILEEFIRISLSHPEISFQFYDNSTLKYKLEATNLKQRIVNLFSDSYKEKLVPIEQETEIAKIFGYIVKPEHCRKSRGEQYFFVNNRYIRHNYLNHAVQTAYEDLIASDTFPGYFIFFNINPSRIDINIHPTKTEVNFLDNQHLYAFLRSAVKRSLGMFSLSPSIDFDTEQSLDFMPKPNQAIIEPQIKVNKDYNPFNPNQQYKYSSSNPATFRKENFSSDWKKLYEDHTRENANNPIHKEDSLLIPADNSSENVTESGSPGIIQFGSRFMVSPVKSGIMVIDFFRANERILFEQLIRRFDTHQSFVQQLLFPQTIDLQPADAEVLKELLPELLILGFDLEHFGHNTFIIRGIPTDLTDAIPQNLIENLLQNYKSGLLEVRIERRSLIARSVSKSALNKMPRTLTSEEMKSVINQLFSCSSPEISPSGKPILRIIKSEEIETLFT